MATRMIDVSAANYYKRVERVSRVLQGRSQSLRIAAVNNMLFYWVGPQDLGRKPFWQGWGEFFDPLVKQSRIQPSFG